MYGIVAWIAEMSELDCGVNASRPMAGSTQLLSGALFWA